MTKQPTEIFDFLAHAIRKAINFSKDDLSVLANNSELVSIVKILPVILDKLALDRIFNLKCEKENLRKKLCRATKNVNEEIEELSADLTEAEEYNEKLIGENDELTLQIRKIDDVLNHNK